MPRGRPALPRRQLYTAAAKLPLQVRHGPAHVWNGCTRSSGDSVWPTHLDGMMLQGLYIGGGDAGGAILTVVALWGSGNADNMS